MEAFEQALQSWSVPSTNQIYADVNGQIAWMPACKAPVRKDYDGMVPVPGDGRYEWDGFHSQKELPREIAPQRGYVASSNEMNLPPGPAQELDIGFEFADPFRAQRVREVLDAKTLHTLEESCKLQCDDLSIPARRVCVHLAGLTSTDKDAAFGLSLLQDWDHHLARRQRCGAAVRSLVDAAPEAGAARSRQHRSKAASAARAWRPHDADRLAR